MKTQTILWPTDLSEASLKAAETVVSLAEKYQARVLLLYVAVDLCAFSPAHDDFPGQEAVREFQNWELEQARKRLERMCADELKACPGLDMQLLRGDPADVILKTIEAEQADMVVLTTRGHGAAQSFRADPGLGSVAAKVIRHSPVSVVTVNPFKAGQVSVEK